MILDEWDAIEADLADAGIDLGDPTLTTRSWRWLKTRILGLLTRPVTHDLSGNPVYASRLQARLAPPPENSARAQQ